MLVCQTGQISLEEEHWTCRVLDFRKYAVLSYMCAYSFEWASQLYLSRLRGGERESRRLSLSSRAGERELRRLSSLRGDGESRRCDGTRRPSTRAGERESLRRWSLRGDGESRRLSPPRRGDLESWRRSSRRGGDRECLRRSSLRGECECLSRCWCWWWWWASPLPASFLMYSRNSCIGPRPSGLRDRLRPTSATGLFLAESSSLSLLSPRCGQVSSLDAINRRPTSIAAMQKREGS
jgi:hypothetical protein